MGFVQIDVDCGKCRVTDQIDAIANVLEILKFIVIHKCMTQLIEKITKEVFKVNQNLVAMRHSKIKEKQVWLHIMLLVVGFVWRKCANELTSDAKTIRENNEITTK